MDQYFNLIFLMKNILSLALQVVQTEGYGMLTNDGQITVQNKRQTKVFVNFCSFLFKLF